MAGLNVAEWTPDQVADWISGLGPTVAQYVPTLRERGLNGAKLLMLRCDDLEFLGMHIIGHQELLLEAVEHLRNFQYELSRECVQQLAVRVSVVATTLARTLRHHTDARLETQTLADVARTVQAVKPLVCWLDRWPGGAGGAGVADRKAALLRIALEAATCAQRDRFAEQPARAVAAAAAAAAAAADYLVQEVAEPAALQPSALDAVSLRQRGRALGFALEASCCGHAQLADVRFGSPAHASAAVHAGDEIVQVGAQCVVGWPPDEVLAACSRHQDLALRLRRRGARPALPLHARRRREPPLPLPLPDSPPPSERGSITCAATPANACAAGGASAGAGAGAGVGAPAGALAAPARLAAGEAGRTRTDSAGDSSEDSEPLSPPASPTHPHLDHNRMYPSKRRGVAQRRHSVSGGTPRARRPHHHMHQFWQELREQKWSGSVSTSPAPGDDAALYARDKAVSYSTGLELSPRPRTCLGLGPEPAAEPPGGERGRGKLDKSHSTPAYDFDASLEEPGALVAQVIPESPTAPAAPTDSPTVLVHSAEKADQILDFKKSSSQIGEAILQQRTRRGTDEEPAHTEFDEENCFGSAGGAEGTGERDDSTTEKILETINIAMMEHRRRSILDGRAIESAKVTKLATGDRGREDAAEELRINTPRYPYLRSVSSRSSRADTPPEPPPRPPALAAPPPGASEFGVLRALPRTPDRAEPTSPLKPIRPIDAGQISVPLRHITKHDIRVIPSERHELPPINSEAESPTASAALRRGGSQGTNPGDIVMGAHVSSDVTPARGLALSPTSAVRGIFPTSKSRSLKKKSSILAKRRAVPARALSARGAAGGAWQRVRAGGGGAQARWARRHLVLAHGLLYAYRAAESARAACMIRLEGFTVCAASEVRSRDHAFKVYHTGTAFYFAAESRDSMLAWIQLIHRATLVPAPPACAAGDRYSETEYSETESDERDRDRDRDRERDRDKSKFGSLKKLTHRAQRSDSQENVTHSSTSLDRKYLRFFSRNKSKDDTKTTKSKPGVPVPTEQYRSYRRVPAPATLATPATPAAPAAPRPPDPTHYIHASNPNLLDFEKTDFVAKPPLQAPKPKPKTEKSCGLVTLEQFMLEKQAEERRQVYSERVLLGVRRAGPAPHHQHHQQHHSDLQRQLHDIVPDVIYGEIPRPPSPSAQAAAHSVTGSDGYEKIVYAGSASPPPAPAPAPAPDRWRDSLRRNDKVHSAGGKEGAGAPDLGAACLSPRGPTSPGAGAAPVSVPAPAPARSSPDRWCVSAGGGGGGGGAGGGGGGAVATTGPGVSRLRLMFSARTQRDRSQAASPAVGGGVSGGGGGVGGVSARRSSSSAGSLSLSPLRNLNQYPHLQCPPTFHPETYSLAALSPHHPAPMPAPAPAPPAPHTPRTPARHHYK